MPTSPTRNDMARLAPYLVARTRRGVVGSSRYASKLRQAIHDAAQDPSRKTVLISGEPGLEKDNLAGLIHFGSADRDKLFLRFNASKMRADGAELFGRPGSQEPALLDTLPDATLLIDCIDLAPAALRSRLIGLISSPHPNFHGRIIFTAESSMPELKGLANQIRVPPLRVRRSDLGEWLRYSVRQQSGMFGWDQPPSIPDTVVKRLQSHDFPNNIRELEALVERALLQARKQAVAKQHSPSQEPVALPAALPEEVFWVNSRERTLRFDIWAWKPQLRDLMRSQRLWQVLLFAVVSWLFIAVNLALWIGPQTRADNSVMKLFWGWWWPLILLTFPLVGRLWCAFCPFMVWGSIAQSSKQALASLSEQLGWGKQWLRLRPWPQQDNDRWGGPFLAASFALILIWEEVWNLPDTAWLSSCLLLLITAGAVVCSLLFEKRFWCRYLCPIGGMNGLFAKLSILELRAQSGTCAGSCSSYACFKGGPKEGEGMATAGCPLGTHPAHLRDNRNCVLCMSCAQACPHRSVQLRLRPPAADLQRDLESPAGERGLILVLAGGITLHHWDRLLGWLPLAPDSLQAGPLLARLTFATLALSLPTVLGLWLDRRWLYSGLPLLWGLLLARHLPIGMAEAGTLLPQGWPSWSADTNVINFCQSLVVATAWAGSAVLLSRLITRSWFPWILASSALLMVALGGRWLLQG